MTTLMDYGNDLAEGVCPICEQPGCSLAHLYDRLVVPAVNFTARWLSRVFLLAGVSIFVAIFAGWISP
ncbi:hypothetical protein GCM10023196_035290 [Actinoallomurus vinaceus]|uniref:Uncharacterized protein n=1 Tax=Actinoallomurus vinaceus TaxID=1080074 RepID=A0ABP8UAL1_9ACTN